MREIEELLKHVESASEELEQAIELYNKIPWKSRKIRHMHADIQHAYETLKLSHADFTAPESEDY